MATPVSVDIPHQLGKAEARRRIQEGFGRMTQQMAGGMAGMLSFHQGWEGDRLSFEGGGLGQKITGRLDVREDSVHLEVDLPAMLAAIADKIGGRLKQEGKKLLQKK